jgi:hypothetical protein
MTEDVIREINTVPYKHLEQDVLNYLCRPHIRKLPSCYSDSFVSDPCEHPRIKHFVSLAKKGFAPAVEPYERMAWDELPYVKKGDKQHG